MIARLTPALLLAAAPISASMGQTSAELTGFEAQQVAAAVFKNPSDAIHADPRFEPEQADPLISIVWTRDNQGHIWADLVYRNPDTGIFAFMNERFEFS